LCAFFCFANNARAASNNDSLLGYWKFDGNGNDSSGDGSTVVALNLAVYNSNKPTTTFPNSQSLAFSGAGSSATFAGQNNLKPVSALSFSVWVYLDAFPTGIANFGNYSGGSNTGFFLSISPSSVSFSIGNGATATSASFSTTQLPVATWTHLVGTWDGSMIRIYKSGTDIQSVSYVGNIVYTGASFQVGNFLGNIDDMRLYNRALSLSEISALGSGHHTSASWIGGTNPYYDTPANWDTGAVPDPYTLVTINPATYQPNFLSYPEEMSGLTISSGALLNILGNNLTINDAVAGSFSNDGTLILNNDNSQILSGFTNDTDSGTVEISPTAAVTGLKTGYAYYNLTINPAPSIAVTLGANLQINGNLTLQNGVLYAGNYNINLKGNWIKGSGSFNPGNSTVTLSGTNQMITGSNAFYNLIKAVSTAATLIFEATSTQAISHNLILQGAGSASQFLSLISSISGTQWNLYPTTGTVDVSGVNIKDSYNHGTNITLPGRNIDSGNNINWIFDTTPPDITLDTINANTANNHQPITGSTSDLMTTIARVQFQMEITSGNWIDCVANDGTFNGSPESFTCTPPSALADGPHRMYVLAKDANNNSNTQYADFTVDTTPPSLSEITPVTNPTGDSTPDYTFHTSEAGPITYGGDCSAGSPSAATGNNTVNFNTLADGPHTNCTIQVTDAVGNISGLLIVSPFIVAVPPVISSISVDESSSAATISWTTDETATSKVDYGLSSAYGVSTAEADTATLVTGHRVALSGLSSCTTYHYRVRSKDSSSNESVSLEDNTFKTTGCTDSCSNGDPDKPELTEARALDNSSIKIFYNDSSGTVDHYELKYGTSPDSYEWSVDDIGGKKKEVYIINDLKPGVTYYFRIRAVNDCGKSNWTTEVSATTDHETVASAITEQAPAAETATPPATNTAAPSTENSLLEKLPASTSSSQGQVQNPANFESVKDSSVAPSDDISVSTVEMADSNAGKKIKIGGKGPPNTILTVYIYSGDPIVATVKTDSNGDWTYTIDKELENGNHEVYVAVTNNTGAIKARSNPLPFVKTAQAVTVTSPAESAAERGIWSKGGIYIYIIVVFVGLFLALVLIGLYKRGISGKEEILGA